jgi:protein-S-isoprenylcysteine O-methyltransferase Ste14
MENKEPFDIFKFVVEKKVLVTCVAFALFILISDPSKASVFFGIIFCIAGEIIRTLSVAESKESDQIVTTGIYGYVRNPIYLGSFLIGLGVFIMGNIFIFTIFYIIVFLYICSEKIKAEEEELKEKYKEEFEDYALHVPALLPRITPFNGSKLSFDLGMLRVNNEYQVWLAIYAVTILMFLKT